MDLLAAISGNARPADAVVASFLRNRRYMGAKDRAAVTGRVYGTLRHRARLTWHLQANGVVEPDARALVLAHLALEDRLSVAAISDLCSGETHAPEPLTDAEGRWLGALADQPMAPPAMPEYTRWELPDWAAASLARAFGDDLSRQAAALLREAPLDLRVNTLVSDRSAALASLTGSGLAASPTPLSPIGIRLNLRTPLSGHPAVRSGALEVQDEGSQIVALLTAAEPGMQVVDFCAGAGGKALALAAQMANKGRVVAADVSAQRLDRAKARLRRARVSNVETKLLAGERDRWVRRQKGKFDRVLIDAPCSGSGAWRRNPDARWQPVDLGHLVELQRWILDSASRLAKPGGRVVYATCSLLPEENETQIAAFLDARPEFKAIAVADVWTRVIGSACPSDEPHVRLTPADTGTDGFFIAILERTD